MTASQIQPNSRVKGPMAKAFTAAGNVLTLNNAFEFRPITVSRIGATAVSLAIALTGGAEISKHIGSASSVGGGMPIEVIYPKRTEAQLNALPHPKYEKVTYAGEGADGLIAEANPGILDSQVPGAASTIRELEGIVEGEAPNGNLQYPSTGPIKVPEVPTQVVAKQ